MIRLSKSIIGNKEAQEVTRILLEDGYLGMGAEVGRFETEIANYINVPAQNVVCVNTGTSALHLAVEAVVEKGFEASEINVAPVNIYQDTYKDAAFRYNSNNQVSVYTKKVDLAKATSNETLLLVKRGVVLNQNYIFHHFHLL